MTSEDERFASQIGERAEAMHPPASPLWPRHLAEIFARPRRFFSSQLALGHTPYVIFVTWCFGVSEAIDRIDQELLRTELGRPRPGWESVAPYVIDSWAAYWAVVIGLGAVSGVFLWWIGGWWYRVRLGWAGAADPDHRLARLVYIYASFVWAGPAILVALIQTVAYPNYRAAWAADDPYTAMLFIFPFWSIVTSYVGAITLFPLTRWKAALWFLILPGLGYLMIFGVAGALFALSGQA